MKSLRLPLTILAVLLALLLGAMILLPYLFKDKLVAAAKELINEQVDAEVAFGEVGLSLFRHFPNVTVSLNDLTVDGNEPFEEIRLLDLERLELTVDLFSILFGDGAIILRSISLVEPELNIYVLQNGQANYDIVKAGDSPDTVSVDTSASDVQIQLKQYEIVGGRLLYDDRPAQLYVQMADFDHSGSGNFSEQLFDLATRTRVEGLTLRSGGTSYLNDARLQLNSVISVDQAQSRYTLEKTELTLNELHLALNGQVGLLENDRIDLNLALEAPGNDFKDLLSLLPGAYTQDFEQVQTSGSFSLQASTEGVYDPAGSDYPAFDLNLQVKQARVQYPDLPLPISDINLASRVEHPGGPVDRMRIQIDPFRLQVGDQPFQGMLRLRTPVSDPDMETRLDGLIDLEALSRAFPMEGVENLTGRITADLEGRARLSQLESGNYEQVNISGSLEAEEIQYAASGMPPLQLDQAGLSFSPRFVEVRSFTATLGKSDLSGRGRIDNILAWISPEKVMTGQFELQSSLFDANEWDTGTEPSGPEGQQREIEQLNAQAEMEMEEETELFDRFDLGLDARIDRLLYDTYDIREVRVSGQMSPERLQMRNLSAKVGNSDLQAGGDLRHVWDYLFGEGVLAGNIQLNSNRLDLNELMGLDEEVPENPPMEDSEVEEGEIYRVPDNLNLRVSTNIGRVDYTNMTLSDLRGDVLIQDEAVILDGVSAGTLGGRINLTGRYDSKGDDNPEMALRLGLESMAFQQAFRTFNTFERLAPIGKFIKGSFNTDLLVEGKVGQDMYPVLSSLQAEGFLETFDAVLNQFKPVTSIANALNVQELQGSIPLENTKNWFEIKDGALEVKPVTIKVQDMAFTVAGRQGLDASMDYNIEARIPRRIWENNAVGAAASAGVEELRKQAGRLGIAWEKSEFVDLDIGLSGQPSNPKVKLNLLGAEGSASLGDVAREQAKQKGEELLEEGKEQARELAEEVRDTAMQKAGELVEQGLEQAKQAVKEDTNVQKAVEQIGKSAEKEIGKLLGDTSKTVETIQKELEKFNPFRRNKKTKKDTTGNR